MIILDGPERPIRSRRGLDGLRVLAFCDYYGPSSTGGAERVAREVYTRLAGLGMSVVVVGGVAGDGFDDPGVEVVAMRALDLSRFVGAQLSVTPRMLQTATRLVHTHRPHVLSAQTIHFHSSFVAARVARRTGIPLVSVAHVAGLEHLHGIPRMLGEAHERLVGRSIIKATTSVIAVSGAVERHVLRRGASVIQTTVVPNGVDRDRFSPTSPPCNTIPQILFVGRLIGNKGPDVLVEALSRLQREGVPHATTFVGDGPMLQSLRRDCADAHLAVTFVGVSDEVASWMRRSDIVVRPSFTEGMPLTLLEAMSSGRCVVASAIPANSEVVEDGVNGLLHAPGDGVDLARKLRRLIEDPALRGRLGQRAQETASHFTWDRTAKSHADALLAVSTRDETAPDGSYRPRMASPRVRSGP